MTTRWEPFEFDPRVSPKAKLLRDGTAKTYTTITPFGRYEYHEYRFNNGYGANVVRGDTVYGGRGGPWELAVMLCDPSDEKFWKITYETPVADDVITRLTTRGVCSLLRAIRKLKPREGFESLQDESHETHRKVGPITAEDIEALRRSY